MALGLLIFGAVLGAWGHAYWAPAAIMSPQQEQAIEHKLSRDAAYMRESVKQLAERVGDLQAKLIHVEGTARMVAEQAGISHTEPELYDALHAEHPTVTEVGLHSGPEHWTAESLGRQLDVLGNQLEGRQDWFKMMDTVLTQRQGSEALVPTINPVESATLSSEFGWRYHPITKRQTLHQGVDFAAPTGTPILAASAGLVTEARYVPGYGKLVEISHGNGLVTRYAHASSIGVRLGEVVDKGQVIARVGRTGQATGAHLHFEVHLAGQPVDPLLFLPTKDAPQTLVAQRAKDRSSE